MLYLVRHGRTLANAERRLQGRVDNPIDEVGREQVTALSGALGQVDRVVCSPLLRARQTAAAFGPEPEIDDRWQEIDYGVMDGVRLADVPREVMRGWLDDPDYAPEGGETLHQMKERVWAACADLMDDARDREVVVVTHATPIRAAVAWAMGVDVTAAWRCHVDQASITRIVIRDHHPVLAGFNSVPVGGAPEAQ